MQYTTYLSHNWEQVRELSYLAVSEPALMRIWQFSKVKRGYVHRPPELNTGLVERLLTKLKEGSIQHNLAAAISRSTLSIPQAIFANDANDYRDARGSIWDQDVQLEPAGDWLAHEIVLSAFDNLQHLSAEQQGSYLRSSHRSEIQQQDGSTGTWPLDVRRLLQYTEGIVIVCGEMASKTRAQRELGCHQMPDLCVFVLKKIPGFAERLGSVLRDSLLSWTIYSTVRRDWPILTTHDTWRDRNENLKFVGLDDQWSNRRQVEDLVLTPTLRWMRLLGVPPSDEIPLPVGFDLDSDHQHNLGFNSLNDWQKRMRECADAHQNARALKTRGERLSSTTPSIPGHSHAWDEHRVRVPEQETYSERQNSPMSTASEVGTRKSNDPDIELIDLTQDSD
jgi:hypothetical protein